jgi:hypothetical protein
MMIKDDEQEFIDEMVELLQPIYNLGLLQYWVEQGTLDKDQVRDVAEKMDLI